MAPMARSRKRAAKPRRTGRRASAVTHAVAGFTLSVLAIGAGLLFAGTGREQPPLSEAAEQSATVAAVQIALSGNDDQTPIAVAPERPDADPQPFLTSEQPVINVRGATRVVVESVGIDSEVRTVGFTFRNGRLQYDVPRSQAGQYAGTASPGDSGNTVIGGHVANRGGIAVFEPLPGVKAGDLIEVYSGDKVFRYSVTEIKVVAADATTVMRPTQDATLTLITCFPEDGYRERLVVVGKLL
jgi:LPXTG-site transpeptidase (sortase) family protein